MESGRLVYYHCMNCGPSPTQGTEYSNLQSGVCPHPLKADMPKQEPKHEPVKVKAKKVEVPEIVIEKPATAVVKGPRFVSKPTPVPKATVTKVEPLESRHDNGRKKRVVLSAQQEQEIVAMLKRGVKQGVIAEQFNVSQGKVSQIGTANGLYRKAVAKT